MKTLLEPEDLQGIVSAVIEGLKPFFSGKGEIRTDDIILDVPGLSDYLSVTAKWIHERTHLKEIPYIKLSNKQLRFKKKDIDKWLESLKTPAVSEYRGRNLPSK
jgi:predicted DNA-binding transcriptional regulator AlpA